jgi:hypothetical protein
MVATLSFQGTRSGSFAEAPVPRLDWLWQGYLARGATTLLTSQWKAGKTTLLSVLAARLARGGDLAGLPLACGKAAIVSEEPLEQWRRRGEALGFGDNLTFFCRPFLGRPSHQAWRALIEHLALLGMEEGIDLVVIDPLAPFLPGAAESNPITVLDALQPLTDLTSAGQAVLLLHHPRKGESQAGQAARGSGALCASADIMIEMKLPHSGRPQDRRRRLLGWSRFGETPRDRVIELSPDGADYLQVVDDPEGRRARRLIAVVERLLLQPPRMLTRFQLLKHWPRRIKPPHPIALWRALDAAVKTGALLQSGAGTRNDPFRYGLPDVEARWSPDRDEPLIAIGVDVEA